MSHLIALCAAQGPRNVHRGSIAEYLAEQHDFNIYALHDPLYEMLAVCHHVDPQYLLDDNAHTIIPELDRTAHSIVAALRYWYTQQFGDNALVQHATDIWHDFQRDPARPSLVIPDVRTIDEILHLRGIGARVWWVVEHGINPDPKREFERKEFAGLMGRHSQEGDHVISLDVTQHYRASEIENALASTHAAAA